MSEISFNKYYAGYVYSGSGFLYTKTESGFRGVAASLDGDAAQMQVVLTGLTTTAGDGSTMAQIQNNQWIDLSSDPWTRGQMADLYSQAQAQDYVTRMIDNNKQIFMNNLLCARFADKLTGDQKQQLFDLQSRLSERNQRLLQDGYVSQLQSSEAYGYNAFNAYLQSFMQSGVGLIVSTSTIVITCVVLASVATAAYFAYKYYYEQSARDVKYSDALTRTLLTKLTPEEYEQLMAETKGIVTRASIRARLGANANILKFVLIGAGILFVMSQFKSRTYARKQHTATV